MLGGRAMEIVYAEGDLESFVEKAYEASPDLPILIDKFLEDAIEIDVDAVADGEQLRGGGHHGAHRGSGHPLRRQRERPAPLFLERRSHRADKIEHLRPGAGAARSRAHEYPVRRQERHRVRAGGEPQGDRGPCPS